jgi:mycothiol synthase
MTFAVHDGSEAIAEISRPLPQEPKGCPAVGRSSDEMDREKYLVRPFGDGDYEPRSRIGALVNPEFSFTAQEDREWEAIFLKRHLLNEKWTVEERRSGEVVATGALAHSPFSYHPHKFWADVAVHPDHRGRGIGRALWALVESEAVAHNAECLWTDVRWDDPRSLEFSRKQGFVELRRLWMSTLDLTQPAPSEPAGRAAKLEREGIRFTTLAAEGEGRPEVRQGLFDLHNEAARDVPRMGEYTPLTFEKFVGEFSRPAFLPEAYFIACAGNRYVAMTNLERSLSEEDVLRVGFTGTRAAYRGKGIASELKRRAFDYARDHGIRYLKTVNDSLNAPMWAINERQGFRRTVEWSAQERRFPKANVAAPPPAAK